jgi:hypothetical protein
LTGLVFIVFARSEARLSEGSVGPKQQQVTPPPQQHKQGQNNTQLTINTCHTCIRRIQAIAQRMATAGQYLLMSQHILCTHSGSPSYHPGYMQQDVRYDVDPVDPNMATKTYYRDLWLNDLSRLEAFTKEMEDKGTADGEFWRMMYMRLFRAFAPDPPMYAPPPGMHPVMNGGEMAEGDEEEAEEKDGDGDQEDEEDED